MAELREWPRLNNLNIHHFRLKVKELRYVLQLFPGADPGLVDSLAKVKDDIGDWHDWQQLLAIAREVLDARKDKTLLAEIDASVKAEAGSCVGRRKHIAAQAPKIRSRAAQSSLESFLWASCQDAKQAVRVQWEKTQPWCCTAC